MQASSHDILDDSDERKQKQHTSIAIVEQNRMLKALEQAAGGGASDSAPSARSQRPSAVDAEQQTWRQSLDSAQKDLFSKQAKLEDGLMGMMKRAQKQQSQLQGINSFNTWMYGSA